MTVLDKNKAFYLATSAPLDLTYPDAKKLEDKIRLHTVGDSDDLEGYIDYLTWAKPQLSSEKYQEFLEVINFPLPTVGVTDSIFEDLGKLFESENSTYSAIRFKSDSAVTGKAFNDAYKFKDIMKEKLFETFKSHPNSFFVVEQNEEGDPEIYFVHLSHYLAHSYDNDNNLEYLAWKANDTGTHRVVVDGQSFHHFKKDLPSGEYEYTKVGHNLNFCPADLIYKNFYEPDKKLKIKSPLAKKVGELDWLLFWKLGKKVNDKSAPFPIYSHFEFPCEYTDPATGGKCDGAGTVFYHMEEEDVELANLSVTHSGMVSKACPKCSKSQSSRMIAGSRILIPVPETKDDVDLRDPIQVLNADIDSVEWITKEESRLENSIYYTVVGKSLVPLETFSASETQIDIATESRKNVLLSMSKIFLMAHKKIVDSYAGYIYPTKYLGNDISYGDNWFLRTDAQEVEHYKAYKDSGMPQQMQLAQLRQVIKNRFSTDTDERTKQLLLLDLEPFVLKEIDYVLNLYKQKVVTAELTALKVYFNEIVADLEDKIGHIGSYINFRDTRRTQRIEEIKSKMLTVMEPYKALVSSMIQNTEESESPEGQGEQN